jgi:hypothetical protein
MTWLWNNFRFTAMGFDQFSVIEILKLLNYRGSNTVKPGAEEAVLEKLLR